MRLLKTDLARKELSPGVRTLGQRERSLLLMADGQNTASYLSSLYQGAGAQMVEELLKAGFLCTEEPVAAPSKPTGSKPAASETATPPAAAAAAPPVFDPVATIASVQFDGKRSLATTRMFLFDTCERMFSKRSPEQAVLFRDKLRESRDRPSMLAVCDEMLVEIELVAGTERAYSIRERVSLLLPPETTSADA